MHAYHAGIPLGPSKVLQRASEGRLMRNTRLVERVAVARLLWLGPRLITRSTTLPLNYCYNQILRFALENPEQYLQP